MGNAGAKIKGAFDWLGGKLNDGWEGVKSIGKKAWDGIKSIPVVGKIAEGVEKYTPVGWAATSALKGIDAAARGTSQLLKGDIGGAIGTATSYGRDALNASNPLLEEAKKIPGLGKVVGLGQMAAENIPIYGGMSINTMRSIGNSGLNAVDAFKSGDVKGGLINIAKGGASYYASRGGRSGIIGKAVNQVL